MWTETTKVTTRLSTPMMSEVSIEVTPDLMAEWYQCQNQPVKFSMFKSPRQHLLFLSLIVS